MPSPVTTAALADRPTAPGVSRTRPLGRAGRLLLAVLVLGVVAAALVLRLGLVGDSIGAADNGDGARLYCVAELVPVATEGGAAWRDVAVTEFRTGGVPCPEVAPSTSAGLVLRVTAALAPLLDRSPPAPDGTVRVSLEWSGGLYVALIALGAGIAAYAASARRRPVPAVLAVLAVVVPPVLPLVVVPWWSRFVVSTYAEPAGLLGTVWIALGLLGIAVSRPVSRASRIATLCLLATGGVVAAAAKPGFVPVGAVAIAVCAVVAVGHRRRYVPGLIAALVAVAVAAPPVSSALRAQDAYYAEVNAHNLVFTAVLPESGPAATAALGLRPDAWEHSGEGFYWDYGRGVPGWDETVGARPDELRSAALAWLAEHPRVPARMLLRGMTATLRPELPFLESTTGGARTTTGEAPVVLHPEAPLIMGPMFEYLDAVRGAWIPPALVGLTVLATASGIVARRRARPTPAWTAAGRSAGWAAAGLGLAGASAVLAVAATGVVAAAVIGDGYYELVKHVWLGSYLLVLAGTALATGAAAAVAGLVADRRWSARLPHLAGRSVSNGVTE
jgi:hypothetical protein